MSLRKKIFFSFFVSAFIIAVLAVFEYVNFVRVKDEMRSLEVTDTIRSNSLQLRRHEKNFFLYPESAATELRAINFYLARLEEIASGLERDNERNLNTLVQDYRSRFEKILVMQQEILEEFNTIKSNIPSHDERYVQLLKANFLDRPGYMAGFLKHLFTLPDSHPLVIRLQEMEEEIVALRRDGEDIIAASKALDVAARAKAEMGIHVSQVAIVIVFPLFLIIGLTTLFFISNDLVRRLNTLTEAVEKTGSKYITGIPIPESAPAPKDEVDVLIDKFGRMDRRLALWEEELHEKNRELLESKKLAAIGTLASGVAHELNNPLNNIFLSVQVLKRQMSEEYPSSVREIVEDIVGQTLRVKGIVGDLLEFAREREPHFEEVEITSLINRAYDLVRKSTDTEGIDFVLDSSSSIMLRVDPDLMERVFVNLFSNAVAAISGGGEVVAKVEESDEEVKIWVSDTGEGMTEEDKDKVFDPFFTKKDKGTGLGLAIVLSIIKKHHGTITVESFRGEGTAFEITLPRG